MELHCPLKDLNHRCLSRSPNISPQLLGRLSWRSAGDRPPYLQHFSSWNGWVRHQVIPISWWCPPPRSSHWRIHISPSNRIWILSSGSIESKYPSSIVVEELLLKMTDTWCYSWLPSSTFPNLGWFLSSGISYWRDKSFGVCSGSSRIVLLHINLWYHKRTVADQLLRAAYSPEGVDSRSPALRSFP